MSRGVRLLLAVCATAAASQPVTSDASAWYQIPKNGLTLDSGAVSGLSPNNLGLNFYTRSGKMRAVERDGGQHAWDAMLRFQYRGFLNVEGPVDLHNGVVWRQIGLKLHAANTCNVFYVMWQVEPEPHIGVTVKRNPGQDRHSECDNRGYVSVARIPMPPLDDRPLVNTLKVETENAVGSVLGGALVTIHANGKEVWSGVVGAAGGLNGPMGVRSDGGRFTFSLLAQDRRPYGPRGPPRTPPSPPSTP